MNSTIEAPARIESDRNATIAAIRKALKARSGKAWSVTGSRGTSWGWITITAPPSRATWSTRRKPGVTTDNPGDFEDYDTGEPGRDSGPQDRAELGRLLGLGRAAYKSGESIPAGYDYRREFIDRAEGREPSVTGNPYWD